MESVGLDREHLADDVRRVAGPVLDAARADGVLERVVRERLAPFWDSPAVHDLLATAGTDG